MRARHALGSHCSAVERGIKIGARDSVSLFSSRARSVAVVSRFKRDYAFLGTRVEGGRWDKPLRAPLASRRLSLTPTF